MIDRELAQMILMAAPRHRVELADFAPLFKKHGGRGKTDPTMLALGSAICELGSLMEQIFDDHPELKKAYDARRQKYGRAY